MNHYDLQKAFLAAFPRWSSVHDNIFVEKRSDSLRCRAKAPADADGRFTEVVLQTDFGSGMYVEVLDVWPPKAENESRSVRLPLRFELRDGSWELTVCNEHTREHLELAMRLIPRLGAVAA